MKMEENNCIEKINTIPLFIRKGNKWFYSVGDKFEELLLPNTTLKDVFVSNPQFVQINTYKVLNLNYVEDHIFTGTSGFLVVKGVCHNVPRRFVSRVRTSHKIFVTQKYIQSKDTNKGIHLSQKPKESFLSTIDQIKYLIRDGSTTLVYYKNNTRSIYYDSLNFFENLFDTKSPFLRINRNCLVNINRLDSYQLDTKAKTGIVLINNQIFKISRRAFYEFKREILKIDVKLNK